MPAKPATRPIILPDELLDWRELDRRMARRRMIAATRRSRTAAYRSVASALLGSLLFLTTIGYLIGSPAPWR